MKRKIILPLFLALSSFAAEETYDWGNVRFDGGGFVSAVLFHPKQENLLYARTDVGGVYRFDYTTKTWVPLTDWISQSDVGLYGAEAFAIDPTDPKRLYVLAGTGYFSDGKTAILRSEDYGESFDTTYVEILAHGNGMGRQTGEKLAVDPNQPNIIFCGSRTKGLYKSSDYGKTWKSVYEIALSNATGNGLTNVNGISFVLFDESQGTLSDGRTKTIYMGVSSTTDNLFVSKDAGETWESVKGGPSNLMPHRAKIADGNLFLTYSSSEGPHSVSRGAVYKYGIASGTWTDITPKQDDSSSPMGDGSQSASHGFGGISIDPLDSKHIVVTTLCYYGGRHLFKDGTDGWGDRIYVTKDGGATWTHGQGYNDGVNVDANGTAWIHGNAIHWAGSVEFNPSNPKEVWVTSGNGVFQTDDISKNVPVWKFQSRGIEETVPLDIVSVPDGPLVTAIGDYDGGAYKNINQSTERHSPAIGTTNSLGYASLKGWFLRTGHVTDYSTGTGIESDVMYLSKDNAATWEKVNTTLKATQGTVALSSDGSVILHRGDNQSIVYRSDDNGSSWKTVEGLDGQASYARFVPDPLDAKVFYLVDAQGNLKKSTDKGASFETFGSGLKDEANGLYYNGGGIIRTVPGREGHLWVPLDQAQQWLAKGYSENGLAYSEDGGASWQRVAGVSTAIAVGVGKAAKGEDYEAIYIWGVAGSSDNPLGIYRSTDKGKSWLRINDDKHQFGGPGNGNFVVGDMNTFGVVYMSTVGRGLIVGAPKGTEFVEAILPKFARANASLFQSNRTLHINAQENSRLLLFKGNGRLLLEKQVGKNASVNLSEIPAGSYVARLVDNRGRVLLQKSLSVR